MYELARHTLSQSLVAAVRSTLNDKLSPEAEIANEIISSLATGIPVGEKRRIVIEDERQLLAELLPKSEVAVDHRQDNVLRDFSVVRIEDYTIVASMDFSDEHKTSINDTSLELFLAPAPEIEKIIFSHEGAVGDRFEIEIQHSDNPKVCIVVIKVVSISTRRDGPPPELAYGKKLPVGYDDERMSLLHEYLRKGYPLKTSAALAVRDCPTNRNTEPESDVRRLTNLYKKLIKSASRSVPLHPPLSPDRTAEP